MKIDLSDTTLIIPAKIESDDRYLNAQITLQFLNETLDTNIIIYELGNRSYSPDSETVEETPLLPLLTEGFPNVRHFFESGLDENGKDKIFHRTKYLNFMLDHVKTPVTVNYDLDVLIEVEAYAEAQRWIIEDGYDLVLPYDYGTYQKSVPQSSKAEIFTNCRSFGFQTLHEQMNRVGVENEATYGHLQFFNTDSYREGGMENENFISYGPEDKERFFRFKKLDYLCGHLPNRWVYHLEHFRGSDSSTLNPEYLANLQLYIDLMGHPPHALKEYYMQQEYIRRSNPLGA